MFIMTLSHPPEVNSDLCALKLFGRAECREELGLPYVGGGGGMLLQPEPDSVFENRDGFSSS